MLVRKLTLSLLLSVAVPASLVAKTYTTIDEDGTTWFTDKPSATMYEPFERSPKSFSKVSCVTPGKNEFRKRVDTYSPIISKYAKDFGVHEYLIHAIVSTESCYDRTAVSKVGAEGLMQLMPGTAKTLGVTDPFDPVQNLRAGIEYFSNLQKQFNYNSEYALAAYNAGPGAVKKYAGIPPFPETRFYVKKVLQKFRHFSLTPSTLKNGIPR